MSSECGLVTFFDRIFANRWSVHQKRFVGINVLPSCSKPVLQFTTQLFYLSGSAAS